MHVNTYIQICSNIVRCVVMVEFKEDELQLNYVDDGMLINASKSLCPDATPTHTETH